MSSKRRQIHINRQKTVFSLRLIYLWYTQEGKERTQEGYDMSQQSFVSGCASAARLTTHERDEEPPQDRWSPNTTWRSLLVLHTHTNTRGNRTAPVLCQRVTRWPICFAPLPSGKPGLAVPTDRQPNSLHASWQAGAVTAPLVEDQMLIATRSCCSAATRPPRKDCLSLWWIMRQTHKRYAHPEVLRTLWRTSPSKIWITSPLGPMFHWQRPLSLSQYEDCAETTEEVN